MVADPARRLIPRRLSTDEIKSPVRESDYVAPTREYREVSPGHLVMEWGPEWDNVNTAAIFSSPGLELR